MRFLKKFMTAAVLPLLFISCGDDVTNNYYNGAEGAFEVTVSECDYMVITAHRSYFDPNYTSVSYDNDYTYGMKLTVKLSDPSKRGEVNRLVLASDIYGYDFNKQELEEAYVDSVGGYVFDFIMLDMLRNYSSMIFNVKFYDASNNSSNSYPLVAKFNILNQMSAVNDWSDMNELEISLSAYYSLPQPMAKAETHFLNSKYEEVGAYKSDVVNNKWKAAGIPDEAVYYYFVLTDKYSDVNRKYISARYTIKDRLPDNVEFVSEADNPVKIEYLKNLDKILALSATAKELILFNYDDNSVIWKKELNAVPSTFAYSAEKNTIYLAYINGIVDSVNPADGSGKQLFACSNSIINILPADNFLFLFAQSSYTYYTYDLKNKNLSVFSNSNFYNVYGSIYVPQTRRIYIREDNQVYLFNLGYDGALSQISYAYYNSNNSYEFFRTMWLNSASTLLYIGEGPVYDVPTTQNSSFSMTATIGPFSDMAIVSDSYFATVMPSYSNYNGVNYQSALSVYNSNSVLQGKLTGLAGTPKKVFCKDNALKVYSLQGSGRLIAQKFTVQEVISSASGRTARNKKVYIMKEL
ncbi:MAG TPA: hypothetical protein VHO28_10665 [Ignavibacteriales bacterium]|nr:hypothetical protein [Ignavibacteriales bacterium]